MVLFRHGCLIVNNLDKAIKFYKDNFKLELINVDTLMMDHASKLYGGPKTFIRYAKFKDDSGGVLELIQSNQDLKPHISFTVKNIDAMYRKLKNKVVFLSPPFKAPDSPARVCWCMDADQENIIELVQPKTTRKRKESYGNNRRKWREEVNRIT